jgi:drug/metabolite transporter (DMT)-like permease
MLAIVSALASAFGLARGIHRGDRGGAILVYFFASHDGFLAVTAVLTSLYPAVTIVLARVLLGEELTVFRLAGLGLAGACVALIAAGGAS